MADGYFSIGESDLSSLPKFAYVLVAPVLDSRRFGETVARNRGMQVKAFDNLREAEHWLGIAQSPQR
jgi:hypothetical protein